MTSNTVVLRIGFAWRNNFQQPLRQLSHGTDLVDLITGKRRI